MMAEDTAERDRCRASDLELLRSGDFADVDIVCGERSWKCHKVILASRSVWFHKALTGPFEEASTRRVNLKEGKPIGVDLALKYIYGHGLDVESSVSDDHFVVECVSLYHTAGFLALTSLRSSAEKAVRDYCDKRMKELCTKECESTWWKDGDDTEISPWAVDMLLGIRDTYKLHGTGSLKDVLMEFLWIGRNCTLGPGTVLDVIDTLKDTPDFMEDLLGWYATGNWLQEPSWAPYGEKELRKYWGSRKLTCSRCGKDMQTGTSKEKKGQIISPFELEGCSKHEGGWCSHCGSLEIIPWRDQNADDD